MSLCVVRSRLAAAAPPSRELPCWWRRRAAIGGCSKGRRAGIATCGARAAVWPVCAPLHPPSPFGCVWWLAGGSCRSSMQKRRIEAGSVLLLVLYCRLRRYRVLGSLKYQFEGLRSESFFKAQLQPFPRWWSSNQVPYPRSMSSGRQCAVWSGLFQYQYFNNHSKQSPSDWLHGFFC